MNERNHQTTHRKEFDNKLLSVLPFLHPYVKHRLYIAENIGILPKNLYCSNGVIDDCIIKLHDDLSNYNLDSNSIKLKLFEIVDDHLELLFVNESFHKNAISTNTLLKEELRRMEESFTIDADEDYMMLEDLDDISYHQHDEDYEVFVYDDHNSNILNILDLEAASQLKNRKLVSKFYHWLPIRVATIVDLYTFGKLSFQEIAIVKHIEATRVEKILKEVKKRFRTHVE